MALLAKEGKVTRQGKQTYAIPLTLGSGDISQDLLLVSVWPIIVSICLCPHKELYIYVYGLVPLSSSLVIAILNLARGIAYVCFPCLVTLPSLANKATYSLWGKACHSAEKGWCFTSHITCTILVSETGSWFRLDQVLCGACYSELSEEFLFFLREFLKCQCLLVHQSRRDEETRDSTWTPGLYNPEASNTVFPSVLFCLCFNLNRVGFFYF